jgi:hypothetical protein
MGGAKLPYLLDLGVRGTASHPGRVSSQERRSGKIASRFWSLGISVPCVIVIPDLVV